jgi:hypothetical protein
MAGLISAGVVVDPKKDIYATTGEHLDLRLIPQFGTNKGKPINPRFNKTILQNVLIGLNQVPLVQQKGKDWKWNFPITSEFGPRTAPTRGASSYHQGIDIGLKAGTPIAFKGYGSYRPDAGYGSLMTADPQGNPYEIRFLHTQPGKKAAVGSSEVPSAPTPPGAPVDYAEADQRTKDILEAFMYGTQYQLNPREQQATTPAGLVDELKGQLISSVLTGKKPKSSTNFLDKYIDNAGLEQAYNQAIFG